MYLCLGCDSGYANKGKECIPCIFNAFTHQTFFDTSGMLECVDEDKPVITLPNKDKLCLPHDSDEITLNTDLSKEDLKQYLPTCEDDIDGTLKVDISLSLDQPLTVSEIPVTVTCKDNSGNKQISEYTLTVQDCQKPELSNPSELEFCADDGGNTISFSEDNFPTPLCSDAVDTSPVIEFVEDQSRVFSVGERIISAVCTDAAGLKDDLTYTVQVKDCEKPTLSEPEELKFCADDGGSTKTFDADSFPSPVCNDFVDTDLDVELGDTNSVFSFGDRIITAVCTDDAGLSDTLKYTITIEDCEKPKLSEPKELTFCNDEGKHYKRFSEGGVPVPYPECIDAIDADPEIELSINEGFFGLGECDITAVCTDDAGLSDTLTYTVTIEDCNKCEFGSEYANGQQIDFNNDEGEGFATVDLVPPPTVSDNSKASITPTCSIDERPLPTQVDLNGECEASATIRCTASDEAGNECELEMNVRVTDNEPPKIDQVSDVSLSLEFGQRYLHYLPGDERFPHPMCRDNGREAHPANCPYLAAEKKFGIGSCDIECTCEDPCNPASPVTSKYLLTINAYVHPECENIFEGGAVIHAWYKDKLAFYGGLIVEGVTVVLSCASGKTLVGNQMLTCVGAGDGNVAWDKTPGNCEDATAVGDITCDSDYTAVYSANREEAYCYRLESHEQINHHAMKKKCEATGGNLADINSFLEHETVVQYLNDQKLDQMFVWISTNDIDSEGSYVDGNGNPTELTLWCPDAPTGEEEDCVIDSPMGWNDVKCSNEYYGLCEKPVQEGTGSNHLKP